MPDLFTVTAMNQRDIEQLFAATANQFPLYAMQQCGWLQPETILDKRIQTFWRRMREEVNPAMNDEQADCATALIAVETGIHLDLIGWLQQIYYGATPLAFAQEIARRAYIHNITRQQSPLVKAIQAGNDDEIRRIVGEMAAETIVGGQRMHSAAEMAERFESVVMTGSRTIKTGIPSLDQATGGLERQTEIVIAARPSMGKTALVWQEARNVATSGHKVDYFSLEQSEVSLWARAACPMIGTTWRDVLVGDISPDQRQRLITESRKLCEVYGDNLRVRDTVQTTETIWQTVAADRPDLVVVDHLRLLKDKGENEVKRLGYCSQQLREVAKAFDLPVVVVVQLNRSVEGREDKRPVLSDLRDSGEIEENADLIMMLYSASYYNPPVIPTSVHRTEVLVRKFRDGARNIQINLDFDARREWFESVEVRR